MDKNKMGVQRVDRMDAHYYQVYFFRLAVDFDFDFFLDLADLRGVSIAAWAAASRATGTRNGLQLT